MCGIAGFIDFANAGDVRQVQKMLGQMVHRGPDDHGLFDDSSGSPQVALGHRRLSILDLSQSGHQPMTNEDGSLWVVLNGEIYNYLELRKELSAKGHRFNSTSDTETVLHLYEEYSTDCVQYLRGMFAFALWDSKHRTLFIARDRLGKKPLYYAQIPGRLYFASEIQALYPIQAIGRTLDLTALDLYLAHSYIPSPYSIYKEIKKLPPASTLIVKNQNISIQKYWSLDFAPKLNISFDEAKERLLAHLEDATRIRLYSDVPLGCFLSGGTDSSIVVALMSKLSSTPVKTFSIGFPEREFDETPYARVVASHCQTEHYEYQVDPKNIEILPKLVAHYGEPYADSSALPTWYLSAMTRKHVKVALNGDGGDESFAGYNWYEQGNRFAERNRYCPTVLAKFLKIMIPDWSGTKGRRVKGLMQMLAKNPAARFANLRIEVKRAARNEMYAPEIGRQINSTADDYLPELYLRGNGADELDRMLYTDIMSYLPEDLLVKVDRATMAHSLEARSPFLDHKLMEFVAKLPSNYKLRNGRKKHILKETVAPLFPVGFLDRPKMGFSVPLRSWFRGELKSYTRERILKGKLALSGIFNNNFLSRIIDERISKGVDLGSLSWRFLVLAEWMEENG